MKINSCSHLLPRVALSLGLLLMVTYIGCTGGGRRPMSSMGFGEQLAVTSPHDEPGGRFDGAQLSPGFGVLYINGYTDEFNTELGCEGYIGGESSHLLEVTSAMRFKIVVHAADSLVLGVRGHEEEIVCGELSTSNNDNLSLTRDYLPGLYRVWVGSTVMQTSSAYRLVLSE